MSLHTRGYGRGAGVCVSHSSSSKWLYCGPDEAERGCAALPAHTPAACAHLPNLFEKRLAMTRIPSD
eukprot:3698784-Prymnesium_polylepis.1